MAVVAGSPCEALCQFKIRFSIGIGRHRGTDTPMITRDLAPLLRRAAATMPVVLVLSGVDRFKPPAHSLYPPPVYPEIENADARRRRYMGDALQRTPPELQIVAEPEPGSADCAQVVVRRRHDMGAWHGGNDFPEATKEYDRVSRGAKRCHPVNPPATKLAAHMVVPELPKRACSNLVPYQRGVKRCTRRPVEASPT